MKGALSAILPSICGTSNTINNTIKRISLLFDWLPELEPHVYEFEDRCGLVLLRHHYVIMVAASTLGCNEQGASWRKSARTIIHTSLVLRHYGDIARALMAIDSHQRRSHARGFYWPKFFCKALMREATLSERLISRVGHSLGHV
jgi:hypothetical protein